MIQIVRYDSELIYHREFRQLNIDWISQFFVVEPSDLQVLDHPQKYIMDRGGSVFIALDHNAVMGCCALLVHDDFTCEMAKMAVSPASQGRGVGFLLGKALLAAATEKGFTRVVLEANTRMEASVALYHKLGFIAVAEENWPAAGLHERCNLYMEKQL
jgi:putative acetyltransferase